MGVPSLWRYLEDHRLLRHLGKGSDPLECDHLFIDMNSVMHGCYNPKLPTSKDTIENIIRTLERVLDKLLPSGSVTFAFDGVAPLAKLATQRDRRRSQLDGAAKKNVDLIQAMIVTGSSFVHECEQAILVVIKEWIANKKINTTLPVYLSGFQAPGEGETKLTRRLLAIASDQIAKGTYTGADVSVFVGTDSDLVLGCIGCTPYHNLFVMNPHTEILTDVGSLLTHWINLSQNRFLPLDLLPSFRVDFVACLALAGCDFYKGLEEKCIEIWKQYRFLRLEGGFYRHPLVTTPDYTFNFDLLIGMFSRNKKKNKLIIEHFVGSQSKKKKKLAELQKDDQSMGSAADVQIGVNLLNSALWSLVTLVEGECPSFTKTFPPTTPKPSCIRAAAMRSRQSVGVPRFHPLVTNPTSSSSASAVSADSPETERILPPISVFLGAIGRAKLCPQPFQKIMCEEKYSRFHGLNAVSTIAPAITSIIDDAICNKEYAAQLKDPSIAPMMELRPLHEYTALSSTGETSKVVLVSAYPPADKVDGPCVSVHSIGFTYPSYISTVSFAGATYPIPQRKEKVAVTPTNTAEEDATDVNQKEVTSSVEAEVVTN